MRKLALCIVGGLLLISVNSGANCPTSAGMEFWIKFGFTFHRPKLDCKQGFGLCMDVSWGWDGMRTASEIICPVRGRINDQNQLVVEIGEDDLAKYENGSTLPFFSGHESITLEDPFTFSKEVSRQLGLSAPLTIKTGTYPVSYADGKYTVIFQL